eukprot:jgi/Astpho2/825/Aster-00674
MAALTEESLQQHDAELEECPQAETGSGRSTTTGLSSGRGRPRRAAAKRAQELLAVSGSEQGSPMSEETDDKDSPPPPKRSHAKAGKGAKLPRPTDPMSCPRCCSEDTKFCYYNNYNSKQPRYFCKACQRYWTEGGTLRNVPVGAGRRKNKGRDCKESSDDGLSRGGSGKAETIASGLRQASSPSAPYEPHCAAQEPSATTAGFSTGGMCAGISGLGFMPGVIGGAEGLAGYPAGGYGTVQTGARLPLEMGPTVSTAGSCLAESGALELSGLLLSKQCEDGSQDGRRVRARMAPEASGVTLAAAPTGLGMMPFNGSDQAAPLVDAGFDSSMMGFGMSSSDWLSGAGAMAAAAGRQHAVNQQAAAMQAQAHLQAGGLYGAGAIPYLPGLYGPTNSYLLYGGPAAPASWAAAAYASAPSVSAFKTADLDPAGDTGSFASSMLSGQQGMVGFSKDQFAEARLGFVNPCSTTLSGSNDSCISGASLLPLRSE